MAIKWDAILSVGLLLFLAFLIYTKMKNQTLRETYEEIRDLIAPVERFN